MSLDPLRQKPDFAELKIKVGYILAQKFLEYNDGKFHSAIELNPAVHALAEFILEDRDKFAIGFAEWIAKKSIDNTLPWTETTAELLELYKESLLNQKP